MNEIVYNAEYGGYCLSEKAIEMLKEKGYDDPEKIERHNKDLVEVVKLLGKEAEGIFAVLRIDKIEEDRYYIEEYDGFETVITPRMQESQWIKINNN